MNRNYIIRLKDVHNLELFTSLKKLCEHHNYKYNTLQKKKFPFYYKGYYYVKLKAN